MQNATANGDTRSLTLRHTHTNEKLTITYKVNGRYDDEALKKLNHVLRDWREDQATSMDPHLLDLIWDVYRDVEATEPIAIVCGYRSPGTNAMLRRRSSGVAKFSQHMLGKAMDFYIPGVPLEKLREAGLRASRGGVGFYPSSNFVHLDTGGVRHWPRMPEAELAKVMAKGPIKGPLTAVASRKTDTTKVASARIPNPFAKLFGSGEDEEDAETLAATAPAARTAEAKKPAPKTSDKTSDKSSEKSSDKTKSAERPAAVAAAPSARPAQQAAGGFDLASASSRPVELRPARSTGLVNGGGDTSANAVVSERGFWQSSPDSGAQLSAAAKSAAAHVASAEPTGSTPWPAPGRAASGSTLAYAPTAHPASPARPANTSTPTASASSTARTAQAASTPQRDTSVAIKRGAEPAAATTPPAPTATTAQTLAAALAQAKAGQQFNDPWMRAMIVAPSAGAFMSTSLLGTTDFRTLSPYLQKPAASVMMTFANDPHLGMSTQRFTGTAVVFVSTVTFSRRTASLR